MDDEDDLLTLQLSIMLNPKGAPTIKGTSGIRKMRFAPPRWTEGKRGSTRVLYVYYEEFGIVLLCLVYAKNEVDNISAATKKRLNVLVDQIEAELRRRTTL